MIRSRASTAFSRVDGRRFRDQTVGIPARPDRNLRRDRRRRRLREPARAPRPRAPAPARPRAGPRRLRGEARRAPSGRRGAGIRARRAEDAWRSGSGGRRRSGAAARGRPGRPRATVRTRSRPPPRRAPRPPSRSPVWRSPRAARRTGAMPNSRLLASDTARAKPRAARSTPACSMRGTPSGLAAISASHRGRGQEDAESPAGEAEHEVLGQQLPGDPHPRGADGGAHRQLARPRGRPREQHVRDVEARDQEDQADGAEEDPEPFPVALDQHVLDRLHPEVPLGRLQRKLAPDRGHDARRVGLGLGDASRRACSQPKTTRLWSSWLASVSGRARPEPRSPRCRACSRTPAASRRRSCGARRRAGRSGRAPRRTGRISGAQSRWLRTATRSAPGRSSSGRKTRPSSGGTPKTPKKSSVTRAPRTRSASLALGEVQVGVADRPEAVEAAVAAAQVGEHAARRRFRAGPSTSP